MSIFKRSRAGLNSEFSFAKIKVRESSLTNNLPIIGEKIRIHTFPKGISTKGNAVPSKTWTRVADFISNNYNRYAKRASFSWNRKNTRDNNNDLASVTNLQGEASAVYSWWGQVFGWYNP